MKKHPVLIVILPSILALLTGLAALILYWMWEDNYDERYIDLTNTNSILKNYYELAFGQRELGLVSVGNRMLDISGPNEDELRLKIGHDALATYDELLAFGLSNPDGSMITFTGEIASAGVPNLMESPLTRRSFVHARSRTGISIGEPYFFEQVNDWILPIRVPIRDKEGALRAMNTSAIQYKRLNDNLMSFGLNEKYTVHLINTTFNTTQIYYPLEATKYDTLLSRNAEIYTELEEVVESTGFVRLKGHNQFEKYDFLGVQSNSAQLEQSIIVSVDRSILMASFWEQAKYVLLGYLILTFGVYLMLSYIGRRDLKYTLAIQNEKANLKSLFESTQSIVGLFDENKRLIEFNKPFAEYAKMTDDIDLEVGMNILDHMKNKEIAKVFNEFQDKALQGEKFRETVEYPLGETELCFQLSYNPIYQEEKVVGFSMFVDDITELKTTQKELEKYSEKLESLVRERTLELEKTNKELVSSNKNLNDALEDLKEAQNQLVQSEKMASLGILAAGVGHEINNPLNFIQGGVNALEQELAKEQIGHNNIKSFVDVINEGVRRCSAITESLSNYSRQGKNMNEQCDLQAILENCFVILGNKMRSKVKVKKQYTESPIIVKGNEGKLHQVFLNILTNAEQAIKEKGTIEVCTKILKNRAIVSIKDDGEGILKKNIDKVSDPFFTTKEPGKGTGLGLSIAYSIVDEHNGTIKCNSVANEGTEFIINLPLL